MMRVTDYIADYMYKLGVHDLFMFSGGGMMFSRMDWQKDYKMKKQRVNEI